MSQTFEISHYLTEIKVGPYLEAEPFTLDQNTQILELAGGSTTYKGKEKRLVFTETEGRLRREVRFAEDNRCKTPFEIRYATREDGALVASHNIPNKTDDKTLSGFLVGARRYKLKFTPPNKKPWPFLRLDIYKGFDVGNRNAHFHLDDPLAEDLDFKRNYRRMTYVLDLSGFRQANPPFRQRQGKQPRLWLSPKPPPGEVHECLHRAAYILKHPREYADGLVGPDADSRPDEWIWTWKLRDVTGGFVDMIWEDFLIAPYDVFVSHASEDKPVVRELVAKLEAAGLKAWYDDHELKIGDDLTQILYRGVKFSRTGVVVLSPSFFAKTWTVKELEWISSLQGAAKTVLPVHHEISVDEVARQSQELAKLKGATTRDGLDPVVQGIVDVIDQLPGTAQG
ncbi:MAG: toll/interleukin-1 receptor domain-containing protein [bacterium]|nr:toll/interleukin-1 receptor domain-containing protein [bacterium]